VGEGPEGAPLLHAHNKSSGEIVASIPLPASQSGTPTSFMHQGVQYIALVVSGEGRSELVTLRLP